MLKIVQICSRCFKFALDIVYVDLEIFCYRLEINDIADEHPAAQYRKRAGENLQKQANKMLRLSSKNLKPVSMNDCVTIQIPEFDRGKGDPANVVGIILQKNENDKYEIGTRAGVISNWLERNSFEPVKFKGLTIQDVPNKKASLREIVRDLSVGDGQGKKKCSCKTGCKNKKCACFKNNMKCNSACHSEIRARNCLNHD